MSKARTLADFISDGSEFADGTISVAEVSGAAPLASPTFTGTTTVSGDLSVFKDNGSSSSYDFKSDHYAQLKLTSDVDASAGGPYEIMFTANGSNGRMELRTNNVEYLGIDQAGNVTVNEGGANADFRVESNNNANMIKVDASQDNIGIGKSPGSGQGTLQTVSSTAAVNYYRPAGQYHIFGESSGNGNTEWIYLGGSYTDTDKSVGYVMQDYNGNFGQYAGSYIRSNQAKVRIGHFVGGANSGTAPSLADNFIFDTAGGAVFNERGETGDFRVESDTNTHALFLDAGNSVVGLNISEPHLYYANDLVVGATTQGGITIAGGSSDVNYMMFADLSYGDGRYRGYIEYNHGSDNFAIAASAQHRLNLSSAEAVFNEGSYNTDFRVESDGNSNMLIVDAGDNTVYFGGINSTEYAKINSDGTWVRNLRGMDSAYGVYDSSNNLIATPNTGIRAQNVSYLHFTGGNSIAPSNLHRTAGDWPAPYGIGFGTGGESSGIFQQFHAGTASLGNMIHYINNDGHGRFVWVNSSWEGTQYNASGSNTYGQERMSLKVSNGEFKVDTGTGSSLKAYVWRAWAKYNGTNNTIHASGNVSSLTDNGTGKHYVNFTTALPDANFAAFGSAESNTTYGGEAIVAMDSGNTNRGYVETFINGNAADINKTYFGVVR